MDQLLAHLIPTQRIGNDGFVWWIGQVEGLASEEENNKGGYRCKVRIIGDHPRDKSILDTPDLPWAQIMMPCNVPFMPGNIGGGHHSLVKGCWVIGFYMDVDKQKPIVMGSIGQTPGATSVLPQKTPQTPPLSSGPESGKLAPNPATDGDPSSDKTGTQTVTGALPDGKKRGDGEPSVPIPPKKIQAIKDEEWCQTVAEKCKDVDVKTQMTNILSQMLADIQNNGGQIGTFYINKATGGLNSAIAHGRGYVNKAIRVVTEFLARVKGWIKKKMENAVNDLIKAVLHPNETGNALTPVTEWFNNLLGNLNCSMEDLGQRLIDWLTNVLMSYIGQIYRAAICHIDELVNGIISKIQQLLNELFDSVLGPLQEILGAIAAPLNIIGGAVNYVLKLLGITCSGPDTTCAKWKATCTTGEKKKDEKDKDFLDNLLDDIDNLFGDTPADYTQYVCDEAYTGAPLTETTVGFTGGVPATGGSSVTKQQKMVYNISNIEVEEGDIATFTVTRSGYLEQASSVTFKTLKNQGTATEGVDYLKVDGILGFAPNETEKEISIQTLYNAEAEPEETFFVYLKKNTPGPGTKISQIFKNNVGKCTITEQNVTEPGNPSTTFPANPLNPIPDVPDEDVNFPQTPAGTIPITDDQDTTPVYTLTANRTSCPEGEFIIYTIETKNVINGTIVYYTMNGNGITSGDILGGSLNGSVVINGGKANVTVGIEDDGVVEDAETLRFSLNGKGVFVDVVITASDADNQTIDDFDEGVGDDAGNVFIEFEPPTIISENIITDDNGSIIEIPIAKPGDPWAEPPYIFIGGSGTGAVGTGLLDENGFLTEIRIKAGGFGYKKNLAADKGVRCIIDAFTILRPGIGYTEPPEMYVDGVLGVAEAVINDDGFVIGARILDRTRTFDKFPAIDIIGGNGYGAKLLPSLACLDTDSLSTIGATKIGTGQYIDCP